MWYSERFADVGDVAEGANQNSESIRLDTMLGLQIDVVRGLVTANPLRRSISSPVLLYADSLSGTAYRVLMMDP